MPYSCPTNIYLTEQPFNGNVWDHNYFDYNNYAYCAPDYDGYVLVFRDDFNNINGPNNQTYEPDAAIWGKIKGEYTRTVQDCWFKEEDVFCENGELLLRAKKLFPPENYCQDPTVIGNPIMTDGFNNCIDYHYSAGFAQTHQAFSQGKVEALIKIPTNDKLWPAFWSYTTHYLGGYQEVDGFEFGLGVASDCYHDAYNKKIWYSVHGTQGCNGSRQLESRGMMCDAIIFPDNYHIYDYDWNPGRVTWGLDGNDMRILNKSMQYFGQYPLSNCTSQTSGFYIVNRIMPDKFPNMPIILSNGVGRQTIDACGDGGLISDNMRVQWLKFWMRIDCNATVNITAINTLGSCGTQTPTCYTGGIINVAGGISFVHLLPADNNYPRGEYLTLVASQEINLLPGFESPESSNFEGWITPCIESNSYYSAKKEEDIPVYGEDQVVSEKPILKNNMFLYPNPSNGKLTVEFQLVYNTDVMLYITDLLGHTIHTNSFSGFTEAGTHIVNLNDLSLTPGSYWLNMQTEDGIISKGFVVIN